MTHNALPITVLTRRVLHAVFPHDLWSGVEDTLITNCGPAQVSSPDFDAGAMERIWLAALKKSNGSIPAFRNAVLLAQTDWRDLLMSAGFGSLTAHLEWAAAVAG